MKKIINRIKFYINSVDISCIGEYATGCAYYTILAFIPLVLLILTLTKYFGIDEELFIYIIEVIVPVDILNDAVISIVKEVQSKSVGTITISAVFTLWSAGRGFFALCKGLSKVYGVETEKKYVKFKFKALIYTIIFISAILVSLTSLVFGNRIRIVIQEKFNTVSKIIDSILRARVIISIIILTFIFTVSYRFIPKHSYKFKEQIVGAIFAAIACNVVSVFYAIYINLFTGFSVMYGSLTAIVLAMLWIYTCMYSILLGATINKLILDNKTL